MPLDPQARAFLEAAASAGVPEIGSMPAAQIRKIYHAMSANMPAGPELCRVENAVIPTETGGIPVRTYHPSAEPSGLMVYYHGGGWTIGTIDLFDATVRRLALKTGCAIVSVDYRLAPEHPFPAAVHDAVSAVRWASSQAVQLVGKEVPLIVAGDSAGGNLAAVVSQIVRDEGGAQIAAQILIYPCTDGNIDSESMTRFEPPFLTRTELAWFYDQYVPNRSQRTEPRFAPLHAPNLGNLPSAFVLTAECDLLCEEGELYARRLQDAGVTVKQERYLGTFHGFLSMDRGLLPHSGKAMDDIAAFLSGVLRQQRK